MKTTNLLLFILFFICFSCIKRGQNSDLQLCTNLWQSYADCLKNGNMDSISEKFTKDAIIIYPDIPDVNGKENIQNLIKQTFPNIKMQGFDFSVERFSVADSSVFSFIKVKEKYLNAENIEMNSNARISTLWKLGDDNEWRISLFQVCYKNQNKP